MSGTPRLPVSVLRTAAQRAVDATSLRTVAEAIGMSHPGLSKFLAGGEPRPATVRKLVEWYVRHAAPLDEDTTEAALALLLHSYPESERERVRRGLLDVLRAGYERTGTKPPGWLADD